MSQTSYLREFCAQVSKIVFLADLTVLRLIITDEQKCRKTHISTSFLRKCQIVFLTVLIVLRLITTVWAKMSKNSYLREFCAQVSKIVFQADLAVLLLITTV